MHVLLLIRWVNEANYILLLRESEKILRFCMCERDSNEVSMRFYTPFLGHILRGWVEGLQWANRISRYKVVVILNI